MLCMLDIVSMSSVKVAVGQLTKTEAKLVARSNALLIKVPVVYVESLWVVVVPTNDRSAVVRCLLCNGVGKFAAWRGRAVQDVDEAVAQFLTRNATFISNDHSAQFGTALTQPI